MRFSKLLLWSVVFLSEVKGVGSVVDYYDYPDFTDFQEYSDYPDFTDFQTNDVSQVLLLLLQSSFPKCANKDKSRKWAEFLELTKRVVKL